MCFSAAASSGRPDALKSAKFGTLIFFVQTAGLLGKETGYFMGKDFANTQGKKAFVSIMEDVTRFMSLDMKSSGTAICPIQLNIYEQFFLDVVGYSTGMVLGTAFVYMLIWWRHFVIQVLDEFTSI